MARTICINFGKLNIHEYQSVARSIRNYEVVMAQMQIHQIILLPLGEEQTHCVACNAHFTVRNVTISPCEFNMFVL